MARTRAQASAPAAVQPTQAPQDSPVARALEPAATPAAGATPPESPLPTREQAEAQLASGRLPSETAQPDATQAGGEEPVQHQQQAGADDAAGPAREERIRQAAYRRWEARNGGPGDPVEDWLQAEADVDATGPGH